MSQLLAPAAETAPNCRWALGSAKQLQRSASPARSVDRFHGRDRRRPDAMAPDDRATRSASKLQIAIDRWADRYRTSHAKPDEREHGVAREFLQQASSGSRHEKPARKFGWPAVRKALRTLDRPLLPPAVRAKSAHRKNGLCRPTPLPNAPRHFRY